jgi:hypothetical protein
MLRASAAANNIAVDLLAVADPSVDSGMEHGGQLLAYADAVTGNDFNAVGPAIAALRDAMGAGALVQAAAIAANFSMNDRAANAIGIQMEGFFLADSGDYRAALGINDYPSARNTPGR